MNKYLTTITPSKNYAEIQYHNDDGYICWFNVQEGEYPNQWRVYNESCIHLWTDCYNSFNDVVKECEILAGKTL